MKIKIFILLCIIALTRTALRAQDAASPATSPSATAQPTTQPTPEVSALVADLSIDDFARRKAAQAKLVDLGQAAIPQLRQLLKGELPDEARARVQAAIAQIEDNHLLGPSVITMHYKNAPLQTVLDDFAAQAGADLGVQQPRVVEYAKTRTADIDLDHASFWQALRAVEDVSKLQTQPYNNEGGLALAVAPGMFPDFDLFQDAACTSGVVRIFPQNCQRNRLIQYARAGGGRQSSSFILMLVAVPEPKLRPTGQLNGDWLLECKDERGQSLLADGPQQTYVNNGHQWWWQLQVNLKDIPNIGRRIALLRGELKFNVETKVEVVETDLSKIKDLTRTVGDSTITMKDFTAENGQYELHMVVSGPVVAGRHQWERILSLMQSIQLLDDRNQPYRAIGPRTESHMGSALTNVVFTYMSPQIMNGPGIGPPKKLRWEVASETRQMTTPFELHDLELP